VELVRLIKAANLSLIFGLAILTLEFVEETGKQEKTLVFDLKWRILKK
jgi:hypothetical protein